MALGVVTQALGDQAERFKDDPLLYLIRVCRTTGVGLIVTGVAMGAAGWFMKAAATTAMNNEMNIIGNIGVIFSNIKAPTFQPAPTGTAPVLGPNPIQDVQNFFGDTWSDVQAAGSDVAQIGAVMGTLAEDVGIALTDIAKSFLAFVMHFPAILWNGMVWGVGGAIADVMNWLFSYLIVFGIITLILSFVLSAARWIWMNFVSAGFKAATNKFAIRVEARSERFWDFIFGNFTHVQAVPVAAEPEVPKIAEPVSAASALLPETPKEAPPSFAPVQEEREEEAPAVAQVTLPPPTPEPPPVIEKPVPTPTAEIEQLLGQEPSLKEKKMSLEAEDKREPTPAEVESMEEERVKTLPYDDKPRGAEELLAIANDWPAEEIPA